MTISPRTTTTRFAWRHDSHCVHILVPSVFGTGISTLCDTRVVSDHQQRNWSTGETTPDEATPRRPCLLCVGWLTRHLDDSHAADAFMRWFVAAATILAARS